MGNRVENQNDNSGLDEVVRMIEGQPEPEPRPSQQNVDRQPETGGFRERLNQEIERRKRAESQLDTYVRSQVSRPQEPELDPDSVEERDRIRPFLEENNRQLLVELAPIIQFVTRQMGLNQVEQNIPGFQNDLQSEVDALYEGLTPEEQQKYNSDVGAEALAGRILAQRVRQNKNRAPATSTSMLRATTVGRPMTTEVPRGGPDPRALDQKVAEMSTGDFQALVQQIKDRRLRPA